jgi:hypothetical protein
MIRRWGTPQVLISPVSGSGRRIRFQGCGPTMELLAKADCQRPIAEAYRSVLVAAMPRYVKASFVPRSCSHRVRAGAVPHRQFTRTGASHRPAHKKHLVRKRHRLLPDIEEYVVHRGLSTPAWWQFQPHIRVDCTRMALSQTPDRWWLFGNEQHRQRAIRSLPVTARKSTSNGGNSRQRPRPPSWAAESREEIEEPSLRSCPPSLETSVQLSCADTHIALFSHTILAGNDGMRLCGGRKGASRCRNFWDACPSMKSSVMSSEKLDTLLAWG